MRRASLGGGPNGINAGLTHPFAVEKTEVLVPRDIHQHLQSVFVGKIKEPARRNIVNAQQVGASFLDQREIGSGLFARSEELTGGSCFLRVMKGETT